MLVPRGYQQLDLSDGVAHALTVPSGSYFAQIEAEAQAARWRDDGTNPTTAIGMRLVADAPTFYQGDLSAFRVIAEVTTNAALNVSYYS